MRLVWRSPCDPRTLTRAARNFLVGAPAFETEGALAVLHWISEGYGYDLTGQDVRDPYRYAQECARVLRTGGTGCPPTEADPGGRQSDACGFARCCD